MTRPTSRPRVLALLVLAACMPPPSRAPIAWPHDSARSPSAARSPEGTLGLAEAIELAARVDPRAAAAASRRRIAELQRSDATLLAAPDVLAGGAYTAGFPGSGSNLQLRGMLGSPFFRHYVAGVDASWNLADLLRVSHARGAADAAIEAADVSVAVARRDAALVVIDLFERVLGARATQAVLVAEAAGRGQLLDALRARVAAQTVAEAELLQAEAAIADLDAELATARTDEQSAREALRVAIADDRALAAELRIEAIAPAPLPERAIADALRREADEQRALARLAWLPRVILGASAGYANPSSGTDTGLYALGVAVGLPITGALRERHRREAEAEAADARALELDASVRTLAIRAAELEGAIAGLEASLVAAEASRRAAERARDALAARAAAGVVAHVELEATEVALRRAQLREQLLRVHADGMRARRAAITENGTQDTPGGQPR